VLTPGGDDDRRSGAVQKVVGCGAFAQVKEEPAERAGDTEQMPRAPPLSCVVLQRHWTIAQHRLWYRGRPHEQRPRLYGASLSGICTRPQV